VLKVGRVSPVCGNSYSQKSLYQVGSSRLQLGLCIPASELTLVLANKEGVEWKSTNVGKEPATTPLGFPEAELAQVLTVVVLEVGL
jgi:hypothetical protein